MAAHFSSITLGERLRSATAGPFVLTETTHEPLRLLPRHCHEHANVAFVLGGSFTEIFDRRSFECRAHDLGQQLALALLQQHANADPAAGPPDDRPPPCPHCQRPGRPYPDPDEPLPPRRLTVRDGEVVLRRARFRCTACRAVFFPPG